MKSVSSNSELAFVDINVLSKNKQILHNVSGVVNSGQLLAVMGPTGSGKTTFLNVLAGRVPLDAGTITLNGTVFNKTLRRRLGYVLQDDIFFSNLTVWETLYFTAMIRLPERIPKQEKLDRINEIVKALSLEQCLNTAIGDIFSRGLSGGEKKRTNIACELLTDPDILLLDEPTSGLDSSTAHDLMLQLRNYATNYNKTIVATIHQPSSQIYHMFSSLLLLVEGYTAYFGHADQALNYFSSLGMQCNQNYNPADFLLELLRSDTESITKVKENSKTIGQAWPFLQEILNESKKEKQIGNMVCDDNSNDAEGKVTSYENTSFTGNIDEVQVQIADAKGACSNGVTLNGIRKIEINPTISGSGTPSTDVMSTDRWPTSLWTQMTMLMWRSYKQSKGTILNRYDALEATLISIVASVLYFQVNDSISTIRDRMGLVSFCLLYWSFTIMIVTLASFPGQRGVLMKERAAGAFRLSAYYLSTIISEFPLLIIVPTLFLTFLFWMSGLGGVDSYFVFLGIGLLNCLIAQSIAHVLGALIWDFRASMSCMNVINLAALLLGGFYSINPPPWLIWGKYISTTHYPFAAIMTYIVGQMDPVFCNETNILEFPQCGNRSSEVLTHKEILTGFGVDLPIYCYISTMIILLVLLRIIGYYILRFKR